jgi:CRISPR-associated protein Csy1
LSEERRQAAARLHRGGDLQGAIAIYREILDGDPSQAGVWHLKGVAEHQAGRLGDALASSERAISLGGARPEFLLLQGGVLHDGGDLATAEERLTQAVAAAPQWAPALIDLGSVRLDRGNAESAVAAFRAAVDADPKSERGWNNLGVALEALNRLDDAERAFNYLLTLNPQSAQAHFNLAGIRRARNDHKVALQHAQQAVKADPRHAEAWLLLGDLHRRLRDSDAALAAYKSAASAVPDNLRALNAMADLLAETGRFEDARRGYWQLWQRNRDNLRSALGANLLLPHIYVSADHATIVRREYAEGMDRLHEAAPAIRFTNAESALTEARWTNFYLAYQGRNDRDLQRRYGELHRRLLAPALPEFFAARPKRSGGDRLRVGFLSHFFFNCTAGRYFSSWITQLDPKRFEKFVYYTNEWVADDTRTIAAGAHTFRHLPGRSPNAVARQVIADELDVLVYPELGMHAETFTLAGLRLAPVQACGWGHPNTPGLPNIDWYFSCEAMEPANGQEHYSERLGLLPGLGTRYALPKGDKTTTRHDLALPEDRTLYLVPQSLFKIHPDNDDLIARVLAGDPNGFAVFFAANHDAVTQAFGSRLGVAFRRHELDVQSRAIFLMPNVQHATYLRLNELCDVMLDTLHWSGGNTSLDALASGLPVVTLPGEFMRGRQSQAMLRTLGAPELITRDAEHYVQTALRLGRDAGERRSISERLKSNRDALFERDEPVRALEDLLERAFRETP